MIFGKKIKELREEHGMVQRAPSLRMECRLWQRKRWRSVSEENISDRMAGKPMLAMKQSRRYESPNTVCTAGGANRPCPDSLGSPLSTSEN